MVEIKDALLKKLVHPSDEIRVRTLMQIRAKLFRALNSNLEFDLNPASLMQKLIEWFRMKPLIHEESVLDLMLTLVKNKDIAYNLVEIIPIGKLRKDLIQISAALASTESKDMINIILETLKNYSEPIEIKQNHSESRDLSIRLSKASISDSEETEYELPWSQPSSADYNALKLIADCLESETNLDELKSCLVHVKCKTDDFPVEFFMQPPYLINHILAMISKQIEFAHLSDECIEFLSSFLRSLSSRLTMLTHPLIVQKNDFSVRNQLKVSTVMNNILRVAFERIEQNLLHESCSILKSVELIIQLASFPSWCRVNQRIIFSKMMIFLKSFRKRLLSSEDALLVRLNYFLILCVVQKIIPSLDDISDLDTNELKMALFDYILHKQFPEFTQELKSIVCLNSELSNFLDIEENFQSIYEIFKKKDVITGDELVLRGNDALQTVSIVESLGIAQMLFDAIIKNLTFLPRNSELKNAAIKIIHRLLSCASLKIRSHFYLEISACIKESFALLMEKDSLQVNLIKQGIFGIPLDQRILYEIINFGMTSNEEIIKDSSETIVSLILKSHHLLSKNWEPIKKQVLPMFPLLQCLPQNKKTHKILQDFMNPDHLLREEPTIKMVDVLCGNVRFLFCPNYTLRSEAIYRLAYMLSCADMNNEYTPNIMEISDTIPNDICILKNPKSQQCIFQGSAGFTKSNVGSCLKILESSNMEPVLKKTALMQLNIMCQNEELNAMINDVKAWHLPLQILEESLKSSSYEYQDSAIPAIGIISKLLLVSREFRDMLSAETNIYILVLRSLFLFHTDMNLQQDACLVLFLLVFNPFISGGKEVILPKIFKNIHCPIKFVLNDSEGDNFSKYEVVYFKLLGRAYHEIDCDSGLQFLRMSFNGFFNLDGQNDENEFRGIDANNNLKIEIFDRKLIRISSITEVVKDCLNNIINAVEYENIVKNASVIQTCLTISNLSPAKKIEFVISSEDIIRIIQKFLMNPKNKSEFIIEPIVDLLNLFAKSGREELLNVIATSLEKTQLVLTSIVKNTSLDINLYSKVTELLTTILKVDIFESDLKAKIFEDMLIMAYDFFKKRQLEHEKQTLLVVSSLSSQPMLCDVRRKSCKKLFHLAVAVKTMSQMSSRIQKLSLISIGNLLRQAGEPLKIKPTNITYLSGLCGHKNFEIRNLAWCILEYIAKTTNGVNLLIETLQYLPGKFYSCCLTTMMDDTELTIIRVTAGDVLANIISSNVLDKNAINQLFLSHQVFQAFEEQILQQNPNHNMIRVYCTLIISLVKIHPNDTLMDLIFKLCLPMRTFNSSSSFFEMIGEICRLFIIYDARSGHKITKKLAKDHQFLSVLFEMLDATVTDSISKIHFVNIITFSMLLVRQDTAFNYFCNMFDQNGNKGLQFLRTAMNNDWNNTDLQHKTIHFSTYMLLKSQLNSRDYMCSFSEVIDKTKSDFLFITLENLFLKIFYDKAFVFTQMPSNYNQSICDALSVLLKTSSVARDYAKKCNFFKKILQPIKSFFEKVGNVCSDYIRRYGEKKIKPITQNFILLLGIILNWYSNDVLNNGESALEVTKILLKSWPWSGHNKEMKIVVVDTLAFLSDKSVQVCKNFTTVTCSGLPFTLLQAVTKYVSAESLKAGMRNVEIIQKCLRILQNVCSCSEGRSFLVKESVLSIFDRFQLFEKKMTDSCVIVYKSWLELWEVSSRYTDTVKYQNMLVLEDFCEISNKELNVCSLEIIRNLSFRKEFRNALINRNFFPKLANNKIESGTDDEKLLICLVIWRLIVNNSIAKSKLKDMHVFKYIRKLSKCIDYSNESSDLQKIISIILEIIDS